MRGGGVSIHGTRVFTDWVIDVLRDGGLTVGDAIAPTAVLPNAGYVVVYPIAGGVTSGSLESPRSDASPNVQVTSVSTDQRQCRWLADRVRALLDVAVPAALTDGRKVIWLDFPVASMTMVRDDDAQPQNYYIPDRFELGTTA